MAYIVKPSCLLVSLSASFPSRLRSPQNFSSIDTDQSNERRIRTGALHYQGRVYVFFGTESLRNIDSIPHFYARLRRYACELRSEL